MNVNQPQGCTATISLFFFTFLLTVIYCFNCKIPNLKYWTIGSNPPVKKSHTDVKFLYDSSICICAGGLRKRGVTFPKSIGERSSEDKLRMPFVTRMDHPVYYRETAFPMTQGCMSDRELYLMSTPSSLFANGSTLQSFQCFSRYKHDKNCFKKIDKHLSVWQLSHVLLYHLLNSLMLNRRKSPVKYSCADLADITHHSLVQFFQLFSFMTKLIVSERGNCICWKVTPDLLV